jgi:hypothetical protein
VTRRFLQRGITEVGKIIAMGGGEMREGETFTQALFIPTASGTAINWAA